MNSVGVYTSPVGISGTSGFSGASGISGWSGRSGYSGFSGISGYSGFSGISGFSGFAPSIPPLPTFNAGQTALVASLWNWNPSGFVGETGVNASGDNSSANIPLLLAAPYPLDWINDSGWMSDAGNPPFLVNSWEDQNAHTNPLTASGSARPTLQVTSSVVVAGAGTTAANATYSFRGTFFDSDSGLTYAYYNKVGQSTSTTLNAIVWVGSKWNIFDASGALLYHGGDVVAFPWLVTTWLQDDGSLPVPVVTMGTGSGLVVYDGSSSVLQSSSNLALTTKTTWYIYAALTDLAGTGVIAEVGATPLTTDGGISFRSVAGVVTLSVAALTTHLLNTCIATIADHNPHLFTIIIDTTLSAANQVTLLVDNSAASVTKPLSSDLASVTLSNTKLNLGARNGGASNFLAQTQDTAILKNVADSLITATSYYNYLAYLHS